jgi:membrane-associated phospholipid phosphatase
MPSGHASSAFSGMALANRNLDYIQMHPYARNGLKAANIAAAASVAWARVEGEKHYPTDVLVGAALGNFLTRLVHDSFMNLDEHEQFSFYLEPARDGGRLFLTWEF